MRRNFLIISFILSFSHFYGQIDTTINLEVRPFWKWEIMPKHRINKDFIKNYDNLYLFNKVNVDSLLYLIGRLEPGKDTIKDARLYFVLKSRNNVILEGYFSKAGNCEINGINYLFNKELLLFILLRIPMPEREKYYPYLLIH
jgi:hypothetical protein